MGETLLRAWYGWWIFWLYALRLRKPLNELQRRLAGELHRAPRTALAEIDHPGGVREVLARKQWRADGVSLGGLFIPLDYISDAEVTQARLDSDREADGDCDDLHHWAARVLERMADVSAVYHVSIGYRGGGHVATVYRFRDRWWLLNYGVVLPLHAPADARGLLLKWASRVRGYDVGPGRWLVFETTDLERVKP
jgi:hypothetical protein